MNERWRVGNHWRRTVIAYEEYDPADSDGRRPSDRLIGVMDTEGLARRVVEAVNSVAAPREGEAS